MFARALLAFLVLPGMVAGVIPAVLFSFDPWRSAGFAAGYVVIAVGVMLLFWCVRDFYVIGKGTLAPWSPPKKLVVTGLYRFVRNPMYVSVITVLAGWCLLGASWVLLVYTLVVASLFHLRVTRNEELWLARKFGADWAPYSAAVNRWLPRATPWYPDRPDK
ncbi:MAG: isoprenylcysteine carboxylmethyltransferase family protein [Chromatiales bacterium]|nr:MAG: isoprenylcysteine carboxylmethyltransferase family protein [Chromatiales bacterium]